jgi:hypothetical protein
MTGVPRYNERGSVFRRVKAMTYQGTVQNGVVVFEPGVQLPAGAPVRVVVVVEEVPPRREFGQG